MSDPGPPLEAWMRRALGLGLALVTAKTIMVAQHGGVDLRDPWTVPALLHDHLLTVLLYGGVDLFVRLRGRRRGEEEEAVAGRAMWLVFGLVMLWVAASVPIARALGAPPSLAALREAGGVTAVVLSGLDLTTALGSAIVLAVGVGSAVRLERASRRRVLSLAALVLALVAVLGALARDRVDTAGLEGDPFGVIIQGLGQGFRALLGG